MAHTVDPAIELRKLPPSIIRELALILDYADSWKRLMAIIPKKLSPNGYKSDVTHDNLPKYNSEHFKIIELGGIQYRKSCTEILFDEWGCSGRPRASLGHLKYLLTKAELFRAADYVAGLLGEAPPPRPTTGPAAAVPTNLSELITNADPETLEVEKKLDEINYPQKAIEIIRKNSLDVKTPKNVAVIPAIVVSEVKVPVESFQVPLVVPRPKPQSPPSEISDMMKFSEEILQQCDMAEGDLPVVVPELSILLHQETEKPEVSSTQENSNYFNSNSSRELSASNNDLTPAFSQILGARDANRSDSNNTDDIKESINSMYSTESDITPAFSQILSSADQTSGESITETAKESINSMHSTQTDITPAFSQILSGSEQINKDSASENTKESINSMYSTETDNTPAFSKILSASNIRESINSTESDVTPAFSQIMQDSNQTKNTSESINSPEQSGFLPALSALNQNDLIPNMSQLITETKESLNSMYSSQSANQSDLIPALSAFNQEAQSDLIPNLDALKLSNSGSTKCSSPLPNLSLNTQLPHFSYSELEKATLNFSSAKEDGRFLGAGAFGSVFLANGLLEQPVAVKKMVLENVDTVEEGDEVTKQFKTEVEVLYKYKHDNLVSLLGYSCDGCTYCLVYEYVSGGSLFDVLKNNPQSLPWKQRLHIALGTAKAVAYLHTAFATPLIHRDIKSANILLDGKGNAKLCDFGIVKLLTNDKIDFDTAPCGTSAYMAPEYHRCEISIVLDTFSFGVVLLELLTSLPPLDYERPGADLVTYVEEHCEDSIDSILDKTIGTWEENDINFAMEIYKLTLRCLADKEERPTMAEVVKILEGIMEKL